VAVTADPAAAVDIQATANPLVWNIISGERGVAPAGPVTLSVEVEGVEAGGV